VILPDPVGGPLRFTLEEAAPYSKGGGKGKKKIPKDASNLHHWGEEKEGGNGLMSCQGKSGFMGVSNLRGKRMDKGSRLSPRAFLISGKGRWGKKELCDLLLGRLGKISTAERKKNAY